MKYDRKISPNSNYLPPIPYQPCLTNVCLTSSSSLIDKKRNQWSFKKNSQNAIPWLQTSLPQPGALQMFWDTASRANPRAS